MRDRLVPVLDLRASPYDHSGPLQPLVEFFRSFFRIASTDDPETARSKIASRIEATVPELIDDVSILADFLGIRDTKSPALMLDPKTRHARLINLVSSLVRDGTRTPSVIIIEDIHWLDEASVEFVSALVDIISVSRVLLILTYRPTFQAPWNDGAGFHEIRLDELRDEDVSALTMDLIGDHPSIRAISERIVERSGGNPFFAEELIRSLVDAGELDGRPGLYEAMGEPLAETLPATVQTVIAARIDRLLSGGQGGAADRRDDRTGISPLGSGRSDKVDRRRSRRHSRQIVARGTGSGRDVRRRAGSVRVQASSDPGSRLCHAIAHPPGRTAFGGGEGARTVSSQSTERICRSDRVPLRGREEFCVGCRLYRARRDLDRNHQFPAGAEVVAEGPAAAAISAAFARYRLLRIRASGQIMNAAWREGVSAEEITPFAREALDLAREMKDSVSEVLTLAIYGRISACTGSADDYVKQVLQAIDLSDIADPSVRTMLQVFLCQACGYAGKLREALQASDTALAHIADIKKSHEALLGFNVERWVESLRARLLVRMGNFAAAKQSIDKLTSSEKDHPDPAVQFIPHLAGVELAWLTHDQKLAELHSIRIDEIAASSRIPYVAVYAAVCKALVLSLSGNHVAGIQKLESAIRLATEAYAGMEYQSEMLAFLAEIHLRSNSPTAAFRVAERGLAVAKDRHARLAECRSTIILALVLGEGKLSHPDYQAGDLLARARRLIEETGALPYETLLAAAQPSAVSCG